MDKWSLFVGLVGIAAFLLAIPMSIAANVLTPKIKDWWASTSRERGLRRYKSLGREIIRLRASTQLDALAKAVTFLLGMMVFGLSSVLFIACFIALNAFYIAIASGMKFQGLVVTMLVPLERDMNAGVLLRYSAFSGTMALVSYLIFYGLAFMLQSRIRYITTKARKRQLARLRMERYGLKKRLGII